MDICISQKKRRKKPEVLLPGFYCPRNGSMIAADSFLCLRIEKAREKSAESLVFHFLGRKKRENAERKFISWVITG